MQVREFAQGSFLRLCGINTAAKERIKKVERKMIKGLFFWTGLLNTFHFDIV